MTLKILRLGCAGFLICCFAAVADISGHVADRSGRPCPAARVFAEPGLEGALVEATVSPDGAFTLAGEYYGNVGVFGIAPGYGLGGVHLNIAAGDHPSAIQIVLAPATSAAGRVSDVRGKSISGARIASMALIEPVKVGIPLIKLAEHGIALPSADAQGRFEIGFVPQDALIALKVDHPLYAQEAITQVSANDKDIKITMHRGVSLRGQVTIRGSDTPVSSAVIAVRNAQPPHDTAFAASDGAGMFALRLKPGVYLLQAHSIGRISPGLHRVEITGEAPEQHIRLTLSSTGTIAGVLRDAKTGDPIPGVRLLLESAGQPSGATRTSRDGRFQFCAAEGAATLYFESANGYLPPDPQALKMTVPAGETLELPGFWLAPVPDFTLTVVEEDGQTAVPHAFVSLLHPRQFGWQQCDENGYLRIRYSALPEGNRIIGLAEHPQKNHGALFALDGHHAAGTAVLMPLARVKGRVTTAAGAPVQGVVVGALYADDALPEALPIWRQPTDEDGTFFWPAAPPGAPQRCVVALGSESASADKDINPSPGQTIDVGTITLNAAPAEILTAPQSRKDWDLLCGPDAEPTQCALVFHCHPPEASVYIQAAEGIRGQLKKYGVETMVAVTAAYTCPGGHIPVYRSTANRSVSCFYNSEGRRTFQSVGLPPICILQQWSDSVLEHQNP